MNILKKTPTETFNKKKFKFNLQTNNVVKNVKFISQNSLYCHKNNNNELVVKLSDKYSTIQPKTTSLKRNLFLTLKKVYNDNLLHSTILSKGLYKIRFNHFKKFIYYSNNKKFVAQGRVLPLKLFEKFIINIGFQGSKVSTNLFELTPKVLHLKNINKILNFYINKVISFEVKKITNKYNREQLKFLRKSYFLKNKT